MIFFSIDNLASQAKMLNSNFQLPKPGEVTSTPTRPVDNVVITTKGLQDRNINILDGTTVENKSKLIFFTGLECD